MSLAIYALSKARFIHSEKECNDKECSESGYKVYADEGMEEDLDNKPAGCYFSDGGDEFHFDAGTYSYFDWWCHTLAEILDIGELYLAFCKCEPFYGLYKINGALGPQSCARLASDFKDNSDFVKKKINEFLANTEDTKIFCNKDEAWWWIETYEGYLKAFTIASDDGFVLFQ